MSDITKISRCETNGSVRDLLYSILLKLASVITSDRNVSVAVADSVTVTGAVSVTGSTTDGGPSWTQSLGVGGARYTSADRSGSAAPVTDAPTSGKCLVVTDALISVDTNMRVDLKEETSGTVLASIYMAANTAQQFTFRSPIKLPTADKKLTVQTSASGNIAVTASYYSV